MVDIDPTLKKIHAQQNLDEIRVEVASLIRQALEDVKATFGYWEKFHLAQAIAAFAWNKSSTHQPTCAWLVLCLVCLDKAFVPEEERNEDYAPKDTAIDALTFESLSEDLAKLA
jgi:hypothetical protein